MKRVVVLLLCLGLVGCGPSKEERARVAVYEAADAVLAYFGDLGVAPLPENFDQLPESQARAILSARGDEADLKADAIAAKAIERITAAQALYPAETETSRELARLRVLLDDARAPKSDARGLKAAAELLREQFRPRP